jgi:hypothetical protein
MAKISTLLELQNLMTALLPGAEVVIDFSDNEVLILTNRYADPELGSDQPLIQP